MSTTVTPPPGAAEHPRTAGRTTRSARFADPGFQAYAVLRVAFVVAPLLFGIDKFFNSMTYWPRYLWAGIPHLVHLSPQHVMDVVGGVEIAAAFLGVVLPRLAPAVVALWLGGIVTDLVVKSAAAGGHGPVFWDIAVRDFGLMLAALALLRLSALYAPRAPAVVGHRRGAETVLVGPRSGGGPPREENR